jgi:hypothetical protein
MAANGQVQTLGLAHRFSRWSPIGLTDADWRTASDGEEPVAALAVTRTDDLNPSVFATDSQRSTTE